MLKSTREKIFAQHIDQILLLLGLRKVPVTNLEACEVSEGFAWIPATMDPDSYFSALHQIGLWMFRNESPIAQKVKAWDWALDTSKFDYKRFYKTAALEFSQVEDFLAKVEARIG